MRKIKKHFIIIVLFYLFLAPTSLKAYSFYFEFGAGAAVINSGQSIFNQSNLTNNLPLGPSFNFSLVKYLTNVQSLFQLHLGLKYRFNGGSSDSNYYSIATPYPFVRFEFFRFYFGVGASPWVFPTAQAGSYGFSTLNKASGAIGVFAEGGILWKVSPFFHMSIEASLETVRQSSVLSPKPIYAITWQFRFPFGKKEHYISKDALDYDGWRYPFGIELYNND